MTCSDAGAGGDRIDLSAFGLVDFAAAESLIESSGPGGRDQRIAVDADTLVILEDVDAGDLLASNLIL